MDEMKKLLKLMESESTAVEESSYEKDMDDNKPVIVQGVKGMDSKPFKKKFKNRAAYEKWADSEASGDYEVQQVMNENLVAMHDYTPQDETNVNYTKTKRMGDASVTVSATASDMAELHRVLELAGIQVDGDEYQAQEVPVEEPETEIEYADDTGCGCEEEPMGSAYDTDRNSLAAMIKQKMQSRFS